MHRVAQPLRRFFPIISGVLMLAMGLLTISGRFVPELSLMDHAHHNHATHSGHDMNADNNPKIDHSMMNHSGMNSMSGDHSTMDHQHMHHTQHSSPTTEEESTR